MSDQPNPAALVEVRDPCPHCGDHQLIPRSRMTEHLSRLHPDERVVFTDVVETATEEEMNGPDPDETYGRSQDAPAADPLREQYAAAIEADLEQFFRDHPEEPRNSPWVHGMRDAAAAVRAADAVRDTELQQLRDLLGEAVDWIHEGELRERICAALNPPQEKR